MKLKHLILISLLFFRLSIIAQKPDMYFTQITNSQNLSSSFITSLTQDSSGFIWIGSQDGLNRYDGYNIKVYRRISGDSTSIPHNNILYIYTDKLGKLWIGTHVGLCVYSPEYDNFVRLVCESNYAGMNSINISCITENNAGDIFVSSGNSIYLYNKGSGLFSTFFTLQEGDVGSFLFDNKNNLWIAAAKDGGLIYFNLKTGQVAKFLHEEKNSNSLSHNYVYDIALKDDRLWIATYGGGINSYNIKNGMFKRYLAGDPYSVYVKSIYIDNYGNIWACDLTGLKLYEKRGDIFYSYTYNESDEFSVKIALTGIYQDRQGNYWTLHSPGGVGLKTASKGFTQYRSDTSYVWHTSKESITAIAEDATGNLWLGNYNEGIDIFDWKNNVTIAFKHDSKNKYSIGQGAVACIFRDSQNRMWVCTNMGGLQYYDNKSGHFISFVNKPEDSTSIANNDIRSIAEDSLGNLWLAVHGKGIDKFDRNSGVFTHFTKSNSNLSNDWVFQILIDSEENIWAATAWGLSILKNGSSSFQNYHYNDHDSTSISSNELICLFEDKEDNIWVGTAYGLNLYNPDKNNFTRFIKGIRNPYISSISQDNSGNIWVSTLGGLSMIKASDKKTIINLDKTDGMRSEEYNPRAVYKNTQGRLFFGGIKGAVAFFPNKLKFNTQKPNVLITSLKLFNQEITDYSDKSILKKHISMTDRIELHYEDNVITLGYVALNMIQPEKNQYAYMLEGFENNWNYVGNKQEAIYTNLNPGTYRFRVKASNNDGIWNNEGASLIIRVLPPWWMTLWFKIIIIMIASGVLVIFYFIRTAQLRNQKKLLEMLVNEKTSELRDNNELLQQKTEDLNNINVLLELRQKRVKEQAEELKIQAEHLEEANSELAALNSTKDKLFSIIAHDLRNPFNNILGFSEMLSKSLKELNEQEIVEFAGYINSSSQQVFNLLDNLLKWASSQTNKVQFNPEKLNLDAILKESLEPLQQASNLKEIELVIQKNDGIYVYADMEMLKTVLRNLINNAIKYTPKKGKITISFEKNDSFALVSVIDTGIGMDKSAIDNLFVIEKSKSKQGTEGEKGSGLGLIICKEFIEKNGGLLKVSSIENKGSTFSFTIPAA